ncbi:microtubule-associated protein 4 isoform X2 [Clupea harengus]|uniref:Microtubule-associated protein n=1 Tax=Clupea harengus TaxID=7950 RepID=A0A8M1KQS9_CLUHA|nr:microtubule-associated protein 4 isoform X2 [Clupea harengus]
MADLSLSDALTDGVPQSGPENVVERDFVAQLEAETFDDQVGETVGKTDYIPLLDNDDDGKQKDAEPGLENGNEEGQGAQNPGPVSSAVTPGGLITASRPEPQGEVRPCLAEQQAFVPDFLPDSMAGFSDQWGAQPTPSQMMDSGHVGTFTGFSQPVGVAPLQAERPPSIAEPQRPPPMPAEPQIPTKDAAATPKNIMDMSAGLLGECWPDEAGIPSDLPFTPSVSTVISRHAGQMAESPQDVSDTQWPPRESGVGDEREGDSDRKQQKKKKKRRPRDDVYDYMEVKGHGEPQVENTPPSDSSFRSPRKEGGWEREDGGRSGGGRVKKGKSRKKIPEEWAINAEPFVPASVSAVQSQEFGSDLPEEGAMPASLTQDLLCLTATSPLAPAAPAIQAAAFSPKGIMTSSPMPEGSFSMSAQDSLMDADGSCLGDAREALPLPMELDKADPLASPLSNANLFLGDSGVYEETMFVQDHSFTGSSTDGLARDPMLAFQSTGLDTPMEALISAPPFTPSGAVWSNDSPHNNHSDPFSIPGMEALNFDTPAPASAPVESPKQKTLKDGKKSGKNSRTSSSSSSSAPTKSPTSPNANLPSPQNSGLNPAALPFFPSFSEAPEPPAALPARLEVKTDKPDKMDGFQTFDDFDVFDKVEKTDKAEPKDNLEKTEKMDMFGKAENLDKMDKDGKVDKAEKAEKDEHKEKDKIEPTELKAKTDKTETPQKVEKTEIKDQCEKPKEADKVEKVDLADKAKGTDKAKKDKETDKMENVEKVELKPEKHEVEKVEVTPKTDDKKEEKVEKKEEKKEDKKEEKKEEKKEVKEDKKEEKVEKKEEEQRAEKDKAPTPAKTEKKEQEDKLIKAEKAEKKESPEKKTAKVEKNDKIDKAKKPAAKPAVTSATPSKDPTSPDKKTKLVAGATKPGSAKPRPSSVALSAAAAPKRPTTASTTTASTLSKKNLVPKAPTPSTAPKRLSSATTRPPTSTSMSSTAAREVKPKVPTEKRPLVPKASTATPAARSTATKNGTTTATATSKTTTATRTSLSARTTASAPTARRSMVAKAESKPGEEKKKTSDTKPTSRLSTSTSIGAAARPRPTTTRPSSATPSGPPTTVPERKPPVPRVPRPSSATTSTASVAAKTRPATADARSARSKVGSTDNLKHQPGGGKVSASHSKTDSKDTSQGKVQIVSKKVDYSHVTSRLGSKDNIKHVPGGGNVHILTKKVDLSKVTSKCGSKANMKHKPGGGDVKIESHKMSIKGQPKVGSMENVKHEPGGGNVKAEGAEEAAEGTGAPPSGGQAELPMASPAQAQENGLLKEGPPSGSEGLRDPQQGLDSRIPETN